jgi:16S rRNA C967 or C1407 C5-methylase (RsmB/RsmF family)
MELQNKISFRAHHLLQFFDLYEKEKLPLDVQLNIYFKQNKSLGSHDRKEIAETIFFLIRHQGLIDYYIKKPIDWQKRLKQAALINLEKSLNDESIPIHIRYSFPLHYWELIRKNYSEEETKQFCLISNTAAPITIRVNPIKISRDDLFEKWKNLFPIKKSLTNSFAIIFEQRKNLFHLEEFKQGFFEMQDEGSQEIASLVQIKPKEHLLDYCSGSGGKALAIAPLMQNKGVLFLHDIRTSALIQAKKRLKRAGIQNAQFVNHENLSSFHHPIDWLLLDVPCSGSGTLRRNPDMKWKFTLDNLSSLIEEQKKIFHEAFNFIQKGSKIVYATCSIFQEENEKQIAYFLENYPVVLEGPMKGWLPEKNGKDGFFGAVLKKL